MTYREFPFHDLIYMTSLTQTYTIFHFLKFYSDKLFHKFFYSLFE